MMNPDWLLKHFEQISEAPDAVPRLRRFILDLAVRGKLVEQDQKDEPASGLLKRIDQEKTRLVEAGEIRKGKLLPPIEENGTHFELPASWKWVPIRNITVDRGQKIPVKEFSYVDVSAIDKERGLIGAIQVLTPDRAPSRARKIVQKGDVIYSCVRPYLLNIAVIEEEFKPEPIVSTAFAVLNGLGLVLPHYLWIVLRSPFSVGCVEEKMRGQAYPAINDGDFAPLPFPLPPLAEQHRIVVKVDELMALCDELEAAQAKRERRRDRLVAATLHGLNNGDDSSEPGGHPTFEESARFYFNHLPRLTTRPEHIRQLRQTILNLAIRGRLVRQDPNDEPAGKLLQRILHARKERIASKNLRKQNELIPLSEDRMSFEMPRQWVGVRMGTVYDVRDGTHDTPKYVDTGYPLITSKNLSSGYLSFDDVKFIGENDYRQISERSAVDKGDILLAMIGSIGNPVVVDTDRPFSIKNVALFKYYDPELSSPGYLRLFLQHAAGEMQQLAAGGLQPFVSLGFLRNYPMPLPPLAEQHRIVGKVDELMVLCEELESRLTTTSTTRHQLLEATLHESLGVEVIMWNDRSTSHRKGVL